MTSLDWIAVILAIAFIGLPVLSIVAMVPLLIWCRRLQKKEMDEFNKKIEESAFTGLGRKKQDKKDAG